jgi:hypothetical protein
VLKERDGIDTHTEMWSGQLKKKCNNIVLNVDERIILKRYVSKKCEDEYRET